MKLTVTFNKLQERRMSQGFSVNSLAEASGVSRAHISAIEGHRRMPTVLVMCMLSETLRCQPQDLFEWARR